MSNTVFVLCGRHRSLIGVFDSVESCIAFCKQQEPDKDHTFYVEYFSQPYALIGTGPDQDYTISEEEILHV